MAFKLPDEIYSPSTIDACAFELETYADWMHAQAVKAKVSKRSQDSQEPTISPGTVMLIKAYLGDRAATPHLLEDLAKELVALKKSLPVVHVTLAAMPGVSLKLKLVEWFRQNITPDILISFGTNSQIAGGVVVRTSGQIFDFSFRRRVLDQRARLPELFNNV